MAFRNRRPGSTDIRHVTRPLGTSVSSSAGQKGYQKLGVADGHLTDGPAAQGLAPGGCEPCCQTVLEGPAYGGQTVPWLGQRDWGWREWTEGARGGPPAWAHFTEEAVNRSLQMQPPPCVQVLPPCLQVLNHDSVFTRVPHPQDHGLFPRRPRLWLPAVPRAPSPGPREPSGEGGLFLPPTALTTGLCLKGSPRTSRRGSMDVCEGRAHPTQSPGGSRQDRALSRCRCLGPCGQGGQDSPGWAPGIVLGLWVDHEGETGAGELRSTRPSTVTQLLGALPCPRPQGRSLRLGW